MPLTLPSGTTIRRPPADADLRVTEALAALGIHPLTLTVDPDCGVTVDLTRLDMSTMTMSALPESCTDGWVSAYDVGPRVCWDLTAEMDGFRVALRYHSDRLPVGGVCVGTWPFEFTRPDGAK